MWLWVEAGQRWTCTLHGDGSRSVFRHFQTDLPIHTPGGQEDYIKGWLQRRTKRMVFFYGAHVKNRSTHILGHNSQFHWTSAGVKGNTCLSQPLYHYYSEISVPNVPILLFLQKNPLTSPGPEFFEGGGGGGLGSRSVGIFIYWQAKIKNLWRGGGVKPPNPPPLDPLLYYIYSQWSRPYKPSEIELVYL